MHLTKAYIICISWWDMRVNTCTTHREMVLFKLLYMNRFLKEWLVVCLSVNELHLSESRHGKCCLLGPKGQVRPTSVGNKSELRRPITWNSVESDLGCTSMIYFDNVTLTLHNVTLMSQKPCQHNNKCDCSKTNGYSVMLLRKNNNINFILLIKRFG